MADHVHLGVNASDLTRSLQIHVHIRHLRLLRMRISLASVLFRLAGRILGAPTHVEVDV